MISILEGVSDRAIIPADGLDGYIYCTHMQLSTWKHIPFRPALVWIQAQKSIMFSPQSFLLDHSTSQAGSALLRSPKTLQWSNTFTPFLLPEATLASFKTFFDRGNLGKSSDTMFIKMNYYVGGTKGKDKPIHLAINTSLSAIGQQGSEKDWSMSQLHGSPCTISGNFLVKNRSGDIEGNSLYALLSFD